MYTFLWHFLSFRFNEPITFSMWTASLISNYQSIFHFSAICFCAFTEWEISKSYLRKNDSFAMKNMAIPGNKWSEMIEHVSMTVCYSRSQQAPFALFYECLGQHVICICMQIKCHTVYCFRLGLLHQSFIILQIRILMPLFRHSGNTLGKCAFTILIKVKMKKELETNQGLLPFGAFQMWQNGMNLRFKRFKRWHNQCGSIVKVNSNTELRVSLYFTRINSECDQLTLCTHTAELYSYSIGVCKLHVQAITNANLIQQQRQQKYQYANAGIECERFPIVK